MIFLLLLGFFFFKSQNMFMSITSINLYLLNEKQIHDRKTVNWVKKSKMHGLPTLFKVRAVSL